MGCPGAGKSTVGVIVAEMLGMKYVDFDLDVLENVWGMKVADKLISLGSNQFLEAEAEEFVKFTTANSIISLSGSNPMHPKFKPHAQSLGKVFFLDVPNEDILKYLNKKTIDAANCVVGKHEGMSWAEIIDYRQQFYVQNYDIRILCEKSEAPKSVAEKVVRRWNSLEKNKYYLSTRSLESSKVEMKSFLDVVIQGLASDGGLYVPQGERPYFTLGQWQRLISLPYQERAARILETWIDSAELHPSRVHHMITKAYSTFQDKDIAPIKKLNKGVYIQELFHGPTASFKDLALQLMPQIFDEAAAKRQQGQVLANETKYLVLVATSGDTGSAVLHGFQNCENVAVMVLYPDQGISPIQRQQMTSTDARNVKVLGVQADFDFCQTTVKQIFVDETFGSHIWEKYGYKFSAANSINWGRLLPQVVHHASGYLDLVKQGEITLGEPIDVCLPTGNFGNILAAFYAKVNYDRIFVWHNWRSFTALSGEKEHALGT
ncbi:Threonine synthase-like 1 [Paramuricea clavata]|uniref:Threonine synthase-like 1 n=1 Tax=Paramuricea clavata TaxID=317549 RepID=A0A6S7LQ06_PARCT|nr:Threonine synthase-like 1 [Paramuricea clavata]